MPLSTCLNCQQCINHHCETDPVYFGVHEVIKEAFQGETLSSVAEKLEACSHWTLAENKKVTTQLTFSLKQWHDCLEQLQVVPSPSEAIREIEQAAAHALNPDSDRNLHGSSSSSNSEISESQPDSSGSTELTTPSTADEIASVEPVLNGVADPTAPVEAAIAGVEAEVVDAPSEEEAEIASTPSADEPNRQDSIPPAIPIQDEVVSTHSSPAPVAITISANHVHPLESSLPDESTTPQQHNSPTIATQTVENSINALIDDFWGANRQSSHNPTEDHLPTANSWRGSGRSTQPM